MITREDVQSRYPSLFQIVGGETEAGMGKAVEVIEPSSGAVLGHYQEADESQVDRALLAAKRGFVIWRKTSAHDRSEILHKIARSLRTKAEELAELVVIEQGKTWKEALAEVEQAAGMWQWAAEEGRRAYGRIIPSREMSSRKLVLREPLGPIAAFSSWNAPLITPSRKMSGALAAGCSVIVKAAEDAPACSIMLGKIAYECGLPEGVVSILIGDAPMIAERLISSSVIQGITFTGSTKVGKMLATQAIARMKRPIMELGGHAPVLVFGDVDVEKVARAAAKAKFRNAGQICTAPTRFFVQSRSYRLFNEILVEEAKRVNLGCGFDPDTTMGPLVASRRVDAMAKFIADAKSRKLSLLVGGKAPSRQGFFYEPTIVADATPEAMISNVEPFGPIAMTAPFESYEEAISQANRLPFALASYVHTNNVKILNSAIDDIEAGNVICNGWQVTLPETPFGGHKESGFFSEGGTEGLEAFQKIKYACIA